MRCDARLATKRTRGPAHRGVGRGAQQQRGVQWRRSSLMETYPRESEIYLILR